MYAPPHYREERPEVLYKAISDLKLAALVTSGPDGLVATHLPMALRGGDDGMVLEGHVAIQNPHWRVVEHAPLASVAIFQGPHAYISPSWYESKRAHGKAVPTWNYVAIHVAGALTAVRDDAWLIRHLDGLTAASEADQPHPWSVSDAPQDFIRNLRRAIVGVSLRIDRIEGAWKMIQHRSEGDRRGAMAGLEGSALAGAAAVAHVMRDLEAGR